LKARRDPGESTMVAGVARPPVTLTPLGS